MLLAFVLCVCALAALKTEAASLIDIPPPAGYTDVRHCGVCGDFAGISAAAGGRDAAFVYRISTNQLTRLPTPADFIECRVRGVNANGDACGACDRPSGVSVPIVWSKGQAHEVRCVTPRCKALGVFEINDDGWALGAATTDITVNNKPMLVRPDFTAEILPWALNLTERHVTGESINNRRDIVGWLDVSLDHEPTRGFIFIHGAPAPIFLARDSMAKFISDDTTTVAGSIADTPAIWRFDPQQQGYVVQPFIIPELDLEEFLGLNSVGDALAVGYAGPQKQIYYADGVHTSQRPNWVPLISLLPADSLMREGDCSDDPHVDDRSSRRQIAGCGLSGKDQDRQHAWILRL